MSWAIVLTFTSQWILSPANDLKIQVLLAKSNGQEGWSALQLPDGTRTDEGIDGGVVVLGSTSAGAVTSWVKNDYTNPETGEQGFTYVRTQSQ